LVDFTSKSVRHARLSSKLLNLRDYGGKVVSEIAEELFLGVKTMSAYRCCILEKMRMKSNAELMKVSNYAIKYDS
jgi:DNA-binding NarL/FixJ family response regulator